MVVGQRRRSAHGRPILRVGARVSGSPLKSWWVRPAEQRGNPYIHWARGAGTYTGALAALQLPSAFTQPVSHARFGATVLYYGATALFAAAWLIGAAAVWLLWRPASSAFFKPQSFRQTLPRQV
jgi:hypothetical protein